MKKNIVFILLSAILLFSGCSFLYDNALETDDSYTVTIPKLHLSINGAEEEVYAISGIANQDDRFYLLKASLSSSDTENSSLSVSFREPDGARSYTSDDTVALYYKYNYQVDESDWDGYSWSKSSDDLTFSIDVTQWDDDSASFSFDAVLYKGDSSGESMTVSGYVEDVPFYTYTRDSSSGKYSASVILNGEEQSWFAYNMTVSSNNYSLYLRDNELDDSLSDTIALNLASDISTGTFSTSDYITASYRQCSSDDSDGWSSSVDGSSYSVDITRWDDGGASLTFDGELYSNMYDEDTYTIVDPVSLSVAVEDLPFYTSSDSDSSSTVSVTIDGSSYTYTYSSITNYGSYYQFGLNSTTFGSSNNIGIKFSPDISSGTYSNTSDFSFWYYDEDTLSSWSSDSSNSTKLLTVNSWDGATASFSFSGTLYNDSLETSMSVSATLTDVPIYSDTTDSSRGSATLTVDSVDYPIWDSYFWYYGYSSYNSSNFYNDDGTTKRVIGINIPSSTTAGTYTESSGTVTVSYKEDDTGFNSTTSWSLTIYSIDSSSITFELTSGSFSDGTNTRSVTMATATLPVNSD